MTGDLSVIPESHRSRAADALRTALGDGVTAVHPVAGGASGALTYRVSSTTGDHLLRLEANRSPLRNPHQYDCMQIAAEAGVAPPIRYVDADAGVLVMAFVEQRPISELPGGPPAVAAATASLLARLHGTAPFAAHGDYLDNIRQLIGYVTASGKVVPGLLDSHREAFDELTAAYPWRPDTFVSAHNDPNPSNVLYDGERLWLIDWETASRNDPFIDLAVACNTHAGVDVALPLLRAWLGGEPDELAHARLALMQLVVRLFAGCILLALIDDPAVPQHADLTPMTPEQLSADVAAGRLRVGEPATTHAWAKIMLEVFRTGARAPDTDRWREIAATA